LNDQANSYALSFDRSSRFRFSLMKIPFIVSQITWHSNGRFGFSPGTASTGHVSPPTTAIFLSASHLATVLLGPGQPLLNSALSFFQSLMCPVLNNTTSPSPGSRVPWRRRSASRHPA